MKYLPDTNIFIKALYGREPEAKFFLKHLTNANIALSVIVVGEFYPKAEPADLKAFNALLKHLPIVNIDLKTATVAGLYRKKYSRKTKKVYLLDCFIAAQAKVNNLILVTNNKSDFPMRDIKVITP